jgi:hypothetical protein
VPHLDRGVACVRRCEADARPEVRLGRRGPAGAGRSVRSTARPPLGEPCTWRPPSGGPC